METLNKIKIKTTEAFTLVEVLITLGIIGIIASMLIPTLIANIQKQQYYSKFIKAFTIISQATTSIRNDNNGDLSGVASNPDAFATILRTKMNTMAFCNSANSSTCYNVGTYKTLDGGNSQYTPSGSSPTLITPEGFVYLINYYSTSCSDDYYKRNDVPERCGGAWVDINGDSPPNALGKDIFLLSLNRYNVTPYHNWHSGSNYDTILSNGCNLSLASNYNGIECGTKAVNDREINYY